jgi:hypothetical protein
LPISLLKNEGGCNMENMGNRVVHVNSFVKLATIDKPEGEFIQIVSRDSAFKPSVVEQTLIDDFGVDFNFLGISKASEVSPYKVLVGQAINCSTEIQIRDQRRSVKILSIIEPEKMEKILRLVIKETQKLKKGTAEAAKRKLLKVEIN